jgi:hypothetical protein
MCDIYITGKFHCKRCNPLSRPEQYILTVVHVRLTPLIPRKKMKKNKRRRMKREEEEEKKSSRGVFKFH